MARKRVSLGGSIVELEPGLWRVRVSLGLDPLTGRQKEIDRRIRGMEADARRALAALHLQAPSERARVEGGAPATLLELIDRHLVNLAAKGRETLTLRGYTAQRKTIAADQIAHAKLARLGPADLEAFYARLQAGGRSPHTVRHYHALLSGALRYAHRVGWVDSIATQRAELARVPKFRPPQPTLADVLKVQAAADASDPVLGLALWLAAATGCRRGELVGLQWRDLDGSRLHVRRALIDVTGDRWAVKDTKTHADRVVVLDALTVTRLTEERARVEALTAAAETELAEEAWILADGLDPTGGTAHRPAWLSDGWRRYSKAAKVSCRLHDLRHLHASLLLADGVTPREVADRVGHASTTTTMSIYAHVIAGRDDRSADVIGKALGG